MTYCYTGSDHCRGFCGGTFSNDVSGADSSGDSALDTKQVALRVNPRQDGFLTQYRVRCFGSGRVKESGHPRSEESGQGVPVTAQQNADGGGTEARAWQFQIRDLAARLARGLAWA